MASTPKKWDVEDTQFWESTGKKIAYRNLGISIPNLLCGFSVWLYWGMIAKNIIGIHTGNPELFNFGFDGVSDITNKADHKIAYTALLFTLPAVAGLAGATLRLPNSFMIAIAGGRNVKFMTTILLIIPALLAGIALQDPNVSFVTLIILAAMSGVGGGAFSSSMSNISFFFPKKMQGLSLGLNAGIGNLGVSAMQLAIPAAITLGLFGSFGGEGHTFTVVKDGVETVKTVWIQNAALIWVPVMIVLAGLAWFGMNNLPQHQKEAGSAPVAIAKFLWLTLLGFLGATAGILTLLAPRLLGWDINAVAWTFVVLPVAIITTLALMRYATPKSTRGNLQSQFAIFKNKHNWIMTYLYVMTFGSFIGYANAFPVLTKSIFPEASAYYIFIGAGVGALIRPFGGLMSDKWGGAKVTQWATVIMIGATIAAGYYVMKGREAGEAASMTYFFPFLFSFVVLFATTGIGNGSTFRMIPIIFSKEQAGPVLGFTAAIAAYGAYLIPRLVKTQIKADTPEYALYGFAAYYVTCLAVNWWFYARKNAEIPC
ncbi:MAG: hypothetical protein L3J82_02865 [Planctomycetes bacterium]|nr:hypothetical protein [Planctomycetota bacterium]